MARNTRTFTDLNLLFTPHPATADVTKKVDEEAIKTAIKHLILTKNYERPFHPEIGCQVHSLLFENFTPVTRQIMKRTIIDVINKFEPRATILNVVISDRVDNNEIGVQIEFKFNNSEKPIVLNTTITRIR